MATVIKHQARGDQQIDTANFNRMADGAARGYRLKFDQKYFQQVRTGNADLITMKQSVIAGTTAHRWNFSQYTATSMTIGDGDIIRADVLSQWSSSDAGDVTGLSSNGVVYLYVVLPTIGGAGARDPRLLPDTTISSISKSAVNTWPAEDPGITFYVIGEVTVAGGVISSFIQYYYSNITDVGFVPDAETASATTPVRKTMEWNSTAGIHQRELQWYNIVTVPVSSYRIPAAVTVASGNLALEYMIPDADFGAQDSIEIRGTTPDILLQLFDFHDPVSEVPVTGDFVIMRDATGPKVFYIDQDDFADWIESYLIIDGSQIVVDSIHHHDLLGLDPDDDHGQYLLLSGIPSRNAMSGEIGDNSGNEVFDPNTGDLSWNNTLYIDMSAQELSVGATSHLDWANNVLEGGAPWSVSDTTAAGLGAGALQVDGGIYAANGMYIEKGTDAQAAFFTDGTREAIIATGAGQHGMDITDGTRQAQFVTPVYSAQFFNGALELYLAGGGYAVDAVGGDINIATGAAYSVNTIQVVTDQQAAIANMTVTGAARDGEARQGINNILTALRTHGLIDT